MSDLLRQVLDKADDGQEDCETVYLTISAGELRYLKSLLERDDLLKAMEECCETLVFVQDVITQTSAENFKPPYTVAKQVRAHDLWIAARVKIKDALSRLSTLRKQHNETGK